MLGHRTVHAHLQSFLADRADVHAWFEAVPQPGRLGFRAVKQYPRLGSLDLFELRWRLRWSWMARRILRRHLEATDAVLVHTQSCALLLARECRLTRCVVSVDATGEQYARLAYYRPRDRFSNAGERMLFTLERRALLRAHRVLAWTEWVAGSLREEYGIPDDRIVTLHPGASLEPFRSLPADRARASREPLRALFVGNDVDRKGLPVLVDAVQRLGGQVELDVITGSPVAPAMHTRVHREVTTGSARFVELLSRADVLVLPTRADAAPWVIIEGMAAGLTVISTAVGAIPEILGDAGIIVPPDDPGALAMQLAELAADGETCRRRAQAGRRRAEERYDAARQLPKLLDVMLEAAA